MSSLKMQVLYSFVFAFFAGALLLFAAQSVQHEQSRHNQLKRDIAKEYATLKMLQTEWSFLSRPERLEKLIEYQEKSGKMPPGMIVDEDGLQQMQMISSDPYVREDFHGGGHNGGRNGGVGP